jgi:hypothetical protein
MGGSEAPGPSECKVQLNFLADFHDSKEKGSSAQPSTGEIAWLTEQNEESGAAEKYFSSTTYEKTL